MNLKLILCLSLLGVTVGLAWLFDLQLTELLLWLVISIVYAWVVATYAPGKYFLHGFMVGVLSQVWITAIHAYYLFHTSRNAGIVEVSPRGIHPQVMNLIAGLISGVVTGAIAGLFAFVAAKMLKKVPAPESEAIK